jgi:hypothetical protein
MSVLRLKVGHDFNLPRHFELIIRSLPSSNALSCKLLINWLVISQHSVGFFLRSCRLLSDVISQHFYGTRRLITVFIRGFLLIQITTIKNIQYYLRFVLIIFSLLLLYLRCCLSFWLSHQNPLCVLILYNTYYMFCQSQLAGLDHCNYIWRRVQVTTLFII